MKHRIERRLVPAARMPGAFEVRAGDGNGPPELAGYAAVFDQETVVEDWFDQWRERLAPGAFRRTLKQADIRALFNHDPNIVLGRNKAGTLTLEEDDHGLHTVIRPPDNEWGRPVLDAVKRGDVSGMSISFQVIKDEWAHPEKGSKDLALRTIKEVRLMDVSPVTFPAYEQTEIDARAQALDKALEEDVLLRAGAMARRAQLGMTLSSDDRRVIAEAVDVLRGVTSEPEFREDSEAAPAAHHSSEAADGDPDGANESQNHSPEMRARRLRLIQMTINNEEI